MSKLVVTNIKDGKVSYIMGEEVEVSVEEIKARISEIEDTMPLPIELNSEIAALEEAARNQINDKLAEVEREKARLDQEFISFEAETNNWLEENRNSVIKRFSAIEELKKEKAKLLALLSNIEGSEDLSESDVQVEDQVEQVSSSKSAVEEASVSESGFYTFDNPQEATGDPVVEVAADTSVDELPVNSIEKVEEKPQTYSHILFK